MVGRVNPQHGCSRETFAQHVERMRAFRRSHDFAERATNAGELPTGTRAGRKGLSRDLSILLGLGYVLELIRVNGAVIELIRVNGAVILSRYSRN